MDGLPLEPVTAGAPIRVLLVDDHAMFVESIARVLGGHDDMVVVGQTGTAAEGVAAAGELRPDVVVLDYGLPDGDGVSAARQLRQLDPDVNVVILTGLTDERLLLDAIEAGCLGFLTKDKAVNDLVTAVRAVAAGDAHIPSALLARLLPRLDRSHRGLGSDLTARELEVLRLAARGLVNRAIAEELHVSVHTVRNHVQNAITKLGAHSKLEGVATAVREGLIEFPSA